MEWWSGGVMEMQNAECKMGAIGEFDGFAEICGWMHGKLPLGIRITIKIRRGLTIARMAGPPGGPGSGTRWN
jgi:hypothetical protein